MAPTAKELAAELNQLGIAALQGEPDPAAALAHYQEALKHEPGSPTINYNLGILYDEFFQDAATGRHYYLEALATDPDYVDAHIALCELLIEEENYEDAQKHAHHVLRVEPKNARNLNNLGCLAVKMAANYEEAAGFFEQAVLIDTENGVVFANLADAYMHQGESEEAAAAYEEALRLDPDNAVYCYQYAGIQRHYFRDFEAAETYYKKAIRLAPAELAPYRALRSIYAYDLQDDAKGAQILESALPYFPKETNLLLEIAGIYDYQLGEYEKARHYYEQALALEPGRVAAWSALGVLCAEMLKDYEAGMDAYLRVLELEPDNLHANLNMGHLNFYRFKQPELARDYYEKAVAIMRGTGEEEAFGGEVYLSLGILYEQHVGSRRRALEFYEKAVELGNEEIAKRRLMALYDEDTRVH